MRGKIIDISTDGRGVIRGGKTVFVKNALPGDEVEYFLVKENKNYDEAEIKEVLSYSPHRRTNTNPLGSAYPLYPLEEDYQLELKRKMVEFNMERKAGLDVEVIGIPSDDYRVNKLRLHLEGGKIGLHERNSNQIYTPDYEILFGHSDFIKKLPTYLKEASYVSLRQADNGLFLATDGSYHGPDLAGIKDVNGLRGETPIIEICNTNYIHDIDGFFQNSKSGAKKALELIGQEERGDTLDLYCGVGFISLYVGRRTKSLTGVEINASAIDQAKQNAINNQVKGDFIVMDTADYMAKNKKKYDSIIVDPPRSGLMKNLIDDIKKATRHELVYMSCDLATFTRDMKILKEDFKVDKVYAIDMFKGTSSIECLAKMIHK